MCESITPERYIVELDLGPGNYQWQVTDTLTGQPVSHHYTEREAVSTALTLNGREARRGEAAPH